MLRLLWLAAVCVASVQATNYASGSVSVTNAEITEGDCDTGISCDMIFTATWNYDSAQTSRDDISPITLKFNLVGKDASNTADPQLGLALITTDVVQVGSQFTFPDDYNGVTTTFTVKVYNDDVQESSKETFGVEVFASPSSSWNDINIVSNSDGFAAVGTIIDDEGVELSIQDYSTHENLGTGASFAEDYFAFTVSLTHKVDHAVYVDWDILSPTAAHMAEPGKDYVKPEAENRHIEFRANTLFDQTINVRILDDDIQENLETFEVVLSYPGTNPSTLVKLTKNDPAYRPLKEVRMRAVGTFLEEEEGAYVSIDDVTQEEGASPSEEFIFTVQLSHEVDTTVQVTLETVNGNTNLVSGEIGASSLAGDFVAKDSQTVTFAKAGSFTTDGVDCPPTKCKKFAVTVPNNNVQSKNTMQSPNAEWGYKHFQVKYEVHDSVWALADNGGKSFWNVFTDSTTSREQSATATGNIYDNEGASISVADIGAASESDNFIFTVSMTHDTTEDIPIRYRMLTPDDMEEITATVVAPGACPVGTTCDLTWPPNHNPSGTGQQMHLNKDKDQALTVIFIREDGDEIAEPTETFGIKIMPETDENGFDVTQDGWGINIAKEEGTATLLDNDRITYGFLTDPRREVGEAESSVEFTVKINRKVSELFTLHYFTQSDSESLGVLSSATAGEDYTAVDDTIQFDADGNPDDCENGLNCGAVTFSVPIVQDLLTEANEYFEVVLSHKAGTTQDFEQPGFLFDEEVTWQVKIVDDENLRIKFTAPAETLDESSNGFIFTATLTHAIDTTVEIDWFAMGDTATAGTDFNSDANSGKLTFTRSPNPGQSDTLQLNIIDDQIQEHAWDASESLWIIADPTSATPPFTPGSGRYFKETGGAWMSAKWSAVDDANEAAAGNYLWKTKAEIYDREEGFQINVADIDSPEKSPMFFTISLSHVMAVPMTMKWKTIAGSANIDGSNPDYTHVASATVQIPANTPGVAQSFTVAINDDDIKEWDETFTVELFDPVPQMAENMSSPTYKVTAQGKILDDEVSTLFVSSPTVAESASSDTSATSTLEFTVELTNLQSGEDGQLIETPMSLTLEGLTATKGLDFDDLASPDASIPAGSMSTTVGVTVKNDYLQEITETLTLNVALTGAEDDISEIAGKDGVTGTGEITDDEGVKVTVANLEKLDESEDFVFTVSMTHEVDTYEDQSISVNFMTRTVGAGSAAPCVEGSTENCDYVPVTAGVATFENVDGHAEAYMTVDVINDDIQERMSESGEQLEVVLQDNSFSPIELNSYLTVSKYNGLVGIGDDEDVMVMIGDGAIGYTSGGRLEFDLYLNKEIDAAVGVAFATSIEGIPANTAGIECVSDIGALAADGGPCSFFPTSGSIDNLEDYSAESPYKVIVNLAPADEVVTKRKYVNLVLSGLTVDEVDYETAMDDWGVDYGTPESQGTIYDDEGVKAVLEAPTAMEGEEFVFTVTLTEFTNEPIAFLWETTELGSAIAGEDFVISNGRVEFASQAECSTADCLIKTFTVEVHDDAILERVEDFHVVLSHADPSWDGLIVIMGDGIATIDFSDEGVTIGVGEVRQSEADTDFVFTATLSHVISNAVSVDVFLFDGNRKAETASDSERAEFATQTDDDYKQMNEEAATLVFGANDVPNQTKEFIVTVVDDDKVELDEYFTVTLNNLRNTDTNVALDNINIKDASLFGRGYILDNDVGTVTVADTDADEGETNLEFSVTLSNHVFDVVTVGWEVVFDDEGAMSASASDFADDQATSGEIVFPISPDGVEQEQVQMVTLLVKNDDTQEYNGETVTLSLTSAAAADDRLNVDHVVVGEASSATGTIRDDEGTEIKISGASGTENTEDNEDSSLVFTVSITHKVSTAVPLTFATSDGTALLGLDYVNTDGPVSFEADSMEDQMITVSLINDIRQENDETFSVTLSEGDEELFTDYKLTISEAVGLGEIIDDMEGVTVTVENKSVSEGEQFEFVATLSHFVDGEVTVEWSTRDGTADENDYVSASGAISFPEGEDNASITVQTLNDDESPVLELPEFVTLVLETPSNPKVVKAEGSENIRGYIIDDEETTVTIEDAEIAEAEGAVLLFPVSVSTGIDANLEVFYTVAAGTAEEDADYTVVGESIVIEKNPEPSTTDLEVTVVNDAIQETNMEHEDSAETLTVTLDSYEPMYTEGEYTGFILTLDSEPATGTITDDEGVMLTVSSHPDEQEPADGETGQIVFTVTLSHQFALVDGDALTVDWSTVGGEGSSDARGVEVGAAANQHDFQHASGSLTFAGAEAGETRPITITTYPDNVQESEESFTVMVDEFSHAANLADSEAAISGTATFTDDEEDVTVTVEAPESATELEAQDGFVFEIVLSHAVTHPVSVHYETAEVAVNGARAEGDDEEHPDFIPVSGTAEFTPFVDANVYKANPTVEVTVQVINDMLEEETEYFQLIISDLMTDLPVEFAETVSTAEILESTAESSENSQISIADFSNGREGSDMIFEVTLSVPLDVDLTVSYNIVLDSAMDSDISTADGKMSGEIVFKAFDKNPQQIVVSAEADNVVETNESFEVHLSLPAMDDPESELFGRHVSFASRIGQGIIVDEDLTVLSIDCEDADEADGVMLCPLTLTQAVDGQVSVTYNTEKLIDFEAGQFTADGGVDFDAANDAQFSGIPALSTTASIEIPIINDNVQEHSELVFVVISDLVVKNDDGKTVTDDFSGRVTISASAESAQARIVDDEGVFISINDSETEEDENAVGELIVSLSHQCESEISVQYLVTNLGTADMGEDGDFNLLGTPESATLKYLPGTTELDRTLRFSVNNDDVQEESEKTVIVTLTAPRAFDEDFAGLVNLKKTAESEVSDTLRGVLTIIDDEGATLSVSVSEGSETEEYFTFTVESSHAFDPVVVVPVETVGITATAGKDFEETSDTLYFTEAGQVEEVKVAIINDAIVELEETFELVLAENTRYTVEGDTVATFPQDHEEGTFTAVIKSAAVVEGADEAIFTVSLSHAVSADLIVFAQTIADGSAEQSGFGEDGADCGVACDFGESVQDTTILEGQTKSFTMSVPLYDNDIHENDETFSVAVSIVSLDYVNAGDESAEPPFAFVYPDGQDAWVTEVVIVDDDENTLTISSPEVVEGEALVFDISFGPFEADADRTFEWSVEASDDLSGAVSGTATVSASDDWSTTITIETNDDVLCEASQDVNLMIEKAEGDVYTVEGGEATVLDNDPAVISVTGTTVTEGEIQMLTFTLESACESGFSVMAVSADLDISESLAFEGAAGEQHMVAVQVDQDGIVTDTKTFDLAVEIDSDAAGLTFASNGEQTDEVEIVVMNVDTASITITGGEADEGRPLTFTFSMDTPVDADVEVLFSWDRVTASATDYNSPVGSSVTFLKGDTANKQIVVDTIQDSVVEADEILALQATYVTNNMNGQVMIAEGSDMAEGIIKNDDVAVISVSKLTTDQQSLEGQPTQFKLSVSNKVDVAVAVNIGVQVSRSAANSATCECDSDACVVDLDCSDQSIVIPANADSVDFRITPNADGLVEADETYSIVGSGIEAQGREGITLVASTLATGMIVSTDTAMVGVESGEGVEDSGVVNLSLFMNRMVDVPVTVQYSIAERSATAGSDYPTQRGYSYTIPAFTLEVVLPVPITDDDVAELDEQFQVTLTSAVVDDRDVEASGSATGTIIDDERSNFFLTMSINRGATRGNAQEEAGEVNLEVTLSSAAQEDINLAFDTVGGTAIKGTDFTEVSPTALTLTAGETSTVVTVGLVNDGLFEADETFEVTAMVQANSGDNSLTTELSKTTRSVTSAVIIKSEDPDNFAPVVTTACSNSAASFLQASVDRNAEFDLSGCFTDQDDPVDSLSTRVVAGDASIVGDKVVMNYAEVGTYYVEVSSFDGQSLSDSLRLTIEVSEKILSMAEWEWKTVTATGSSGRATLEIDADFEFAAEGELCVGSANDNLADSFVVEATCSFDAEGNLVVDWDLAGTTTGATSICLNGVGLQESCMQIEIPARPSVSSVAKAAVNEAQPTAEVTFTTSANVVSMSASAAGRAVTVDVNGNTVTIERVSSAGKTPVIVTVTVVDQYGQTASTEIEVYSF